jgi:hypothetical protein
VRSLRLTALTLFVSLSMACSEDDDLKDTRPGDTGAISVEEVAFVDSGDTGEPVPADSGEDATVADSDMSIDSMMTSDSVVVTDSGVVITDSGVVVTDSGVVVTDTGVVVTDTGVVVTDTGVVVTDTGTIGSDTGTPVTDTGTDSTVLIDSGAPLDSGAFDTLIDSTFDSFVFDTSGSIDSSTDSDLDSAVDMDTGSDDTDPPDTDPPDTGDGADSDPGDTPLVEVMSGSVPKSPMLVPGSTLMSTTTPGVAARVAWDSSALTIVYPDVADDEWLHIYVATGAPGATRSATIGSQQLLFGSAFAADRTVAVRPDGAQSFKQWNGSSWMAMPLRVEIVRKGRSLEVRLPFSVLGGALRVGVSAFVQTTGAEAIRGVLDPASLIDGYSPVGAPKTIARFLRVDRTHG